VFVCVCPLSSLISNLSQGQAKTTRERKVPPKHRNSYNTNSHNAPLASTVPNMLDNWHGNQWLSNHHFPTVQSMFVVEKHTARQKGLHLLTLDSIDCRPYLIHPFLPIFDLSSPISSSSPISHLASHRVKRTPNHCQEECDK
jgi:hypothetical protein